MLVEKNLKEALEYYIKGKPVTALWMGEDGSMNAMLLSDILDQPENHFLVDVPAVVNPDFEQAVQDMVEPDQNENDDEGDEQLPPDQPEKKLEKETVAAPGKMSREEKSKIIRPLIKKGLKNKEIAECTGIPLGTVNGLSGPIRKELKNPVKAEVRDSTESRIRVIR